LGKTEVPFNSDISGNEITSTQVHINYNSLKIPADAVCIYDSKGNEAVISAQAFTFDSNFESGNLWKAYYSASTTEFYLFLSPDSGTVGYTQWFLFQVINTSSPQFVRLNIMNIIKHGGLYRHGNRIWISNHGESVLWKKSGELTIAPATKALEDYGVEWKQELVTVSLDVYVPDNMFLATWPPYTYTHLQRHLRRLEQSPHARCKVVGQSVFGNRIEMVTISKRGNTLEIMQDRKGIIILGRVHPGETMSSFVLHGLLDFLVSEDADAVYIRENYVVKIIPMVGFIWLISGESGWSDYRESSDECQGL
jgi:hypothetical protein